LSYVSRRPLLRETRRISRARNGVKPRSRRRLAHSPRKSSRNPPTPLRQRRGDQEASAIQSTSPCRKAPVCRISACPFRLSCQTSDCRPAPSAREIPAPSATQTPAAVRSPAQHASQVPGRYRNASANRAGDRRALRVRHHLAHLGARHPCSNTISRPETERFTSKPRLTATRNESGAPGVLTPLSTC
jgi:hypothetical protein